MWMGPSMPISPYIYPRHNITFAYLSSINKTAVISFDSVGVNIVSVDIFTDRAVFAGAQIQNYYGNVGRVQDSGDFYNDGIYTGGHTLGKYVSNSGTTLASESPSLDASGRALHLSISGSTLKSMRYELPSPVNPVLGIPSPAYTLTATDTTFAQGYYGFRPLRETYPHGGASSSGVWLLLPSTPGPAAVAVAEADAEGTGVRDPAKCIDDPFRPALLEEPVDLTKLGITNRAIVMYNSLKRAGLTDEEICAVLGHLPKTTANAADVAWGSIDFVVDSATGKPTQYVYFIAIYGPTGIADSSAVSKQISYLRSKGKKVFTPPLDYKEIYAYIKSVRPEILITENELRYQLEGREELEPVAVADFYEREVVNLGRIKPGSPGNITIDEFNFIVNYWIGVARRYNRSDAEAKLRRALKA